MTWKGYAHHGDDAGDDAARIARAESQARAVMLKALADLIMTRTADLGARRRLRAADPERWTVELQAELDGLTWRYRRQLPRHLAPRLNPHDPIVRERLLQEARND